MFRSEPTLTFSRWWSSVDPLYQGIFSVLLTTLSPIKADIGMNVISSTSSFAEKLRKSETISSYRAWE